MKKRVLVFISFSVFLFSNIACSTGEKSIKIDDEIILHPRLKESFIINISNLSDTVNLLKNIVVKPKIYVQYIINNSSKTITVKPISQFEELTKYEVTIKDRNKLFKQIFLTGPDTYISIFNEKSTPKLWLESGIMLYGFDSIPILKYHDKYVINPTTICQFALACYDDYIQNNNQISKKYFMKQVDYLAGNNITIGDGIGFAYNYMSKGITPPWYSALAQGQAASVFVRAFFLTHENKYLELAKKSINYMIAKYPHGTLNLTSDGLLWLEEYPKIPQSSVLNGFVFSIFGLIDYAKLFPDDDEVVSITKECLKSLRKSIPKYDTGKWLIYDMTFKDEVNYHYMGMQTLQMKQLYKASKDKTFLKYYYKWEKYFCWKDWKYDEYEK